MGVTQTPGPRHSVSFITYCELNLRASVLKHFCSLGHFHLALKDGEKVEKEKMYRMTDNKKIPTRVQLQVSKGNFGGTEGVN